MRHASRPAPVQAALDRVQQRFAEIVTGLLVAVFEQHRSSRDAQMAQPLDQLPAPADAPDDPEVFARAVLNRLQADARAAFDAARSSRDGAELRLVSEEELLWQIALHKAAAIVTRERNEALVRIQRRWQSLHGDKPFADQSMPYSPYAVIRAVDAALAQRDETPEQRQAALLAFAQRFRLHSADIYQALDAELAALGVGLPAQGATGRAPAPPSTAPANESGLGSLETIGTALAARRETLGQPPASASAARMSAADVNRWLSDQQAKTWQNRNGARAAAQDDGASLWRELAGGAFLAQVEPEARNTIEFMDLVFAHLIGESRSFRQGRDLIRHLQLPVLRMALQDRSFFAQPDHPARRFLNLVGDVALNWPGPERSSGSLHDSVLTAVERIAGDAHCDAAVFSAATGFLEQALTQLQRQAGVLEARHLKRALGQEKLDIARQKATRFVAGLLRDLPADNPIRAFLLNTWTNVLVITLLRCDDKAESYRQRTLFAGWLARAPGARIDLDGAAVTRIAERGLKLVGFHDAEIVALIGDLVKARAALPDDRAAFSAAPMSDGAPGQPALTEEERIRLNQLRSVPFGTVFDFFAPDGSRSERRKLAWFSTVTDRCLFVSIDGRHCSYRTLTELARLMVCNEAAAAEPAPTPWFERAWRAVSEGLMAFVPKTAAA